MKRKLDLNGVSGRFLGAIGLFGGLIPAALYLLGLAPAALGMERAPLVFFIKVSGLVAAGILAVFVVLIVIEQVQDALYHRAYLKGRGARLPAADGYFECPYCGNRRVGAQDRQCGVCGKALRLYPRDNPLDDVDERGRVDTQPDEPQ
jgi:hypothetical protein